MGTKIKLIYPHMQQLANNQKVIEVNGGTLGQGLNDLLKQCPKIRDAIFNKEGEFLEYIAVYINMEIASFDPEALNRPIKDGDEILITYFLPAGG